MLVDPRPYTYEYRKPRYSNPTLYILTDSANPIISTIAFTTNTPVKLPMTTSTRFQASMRKETGCSKALRSRTTAGSIGTFPRWKIRTIILKNITGIWWLTEILRSMIQATNFQPSAKLHKSNVLSQIWAKTWMLKWWVSRNFSHNANKVSNALESMKGSRRLTTLSVAIRRSSKATNWGISPNWHCKTDWSKMVHTTASKDRNFD